ncbi:serine hydrolase [Fodinibius roseus]|nr:serine hydrolase domain-containing protein [Fodinibius roseus]
MDRKLSHLTDFYKQKAAERKVVGSSLAIIRNGDPIYHSHYGLADRDKEKAITKGSIFHWASVTKTFTGIAMCSKRIRLKRCSRPK